MTDLSQASRILVTGAEGFIGSHLVDFLMSKGMPVRRFVRRANPCGDSEMNAADTIHGDLKEPASLRAAVQGCDIVIHLAALSRNDAKIPPAEYEAVNVAGTRALLDAALDVGVKRFVLLSSIEAVGLSVDGRPHTESARPRPRNVYGASKLAAEEVVREFHGRRGMDVVIVRIGATYGPRERLMFQRLFKPISKGFYAVLGDGSALMEFGYVKNQIHGLWLATRAGRSGEIYFVSDESPYRFADVVQAIAREFGVRLRLAMIPYPLGWLAAAVCEGLAKIIPRYPFYVQETGRPAFSRGTLQWAAKTSLICDTTKARTELGYQPPYTLADGLRETIAWYRQNGWVR